MATMEKHPAAQAPAQWSATETAATCALVDAMPNVPQHVDQQPNSLVNHLPDTPDSPAPAPVAQAPAPEADADPGFVVHTRVVVHTSDGGDAEPMDAAAAASPAAAPEAPGAPPDREAGATAPPLSSEKAKEDVFGSCLYPGSFALPPARAYTQHAPAWSTQHHPQPPAAVYMPKGAPAPAAAAQPASQSSSYSQQQQQQQAHVMMSHHPHTHVQPHHPPQVHPQYAQALYTQALPQHVHHVQPPYVHPLGQQQPQQHPQPYASASPAAFMASSASSPVHGALYPDVPDVVSVSAKAAPGDTDARVDARATAASAPPAHGEAADDASEAAQPHMWVSAGGKVRAVSFVRSQGVEAHVRIARGPVWVNSLRRKRRGPVSVAAGGYAHVYASTHGWVMALDAGSGDIVWEYKADALSRPGLSRDACNVCLEPIGDYLVAAAWSNVLVLDRSNGTLVWHAELRRLHYYVAVLCAFGRIYCVCDGIASCFTVEGQRVWKKHLNECKWCPSIVAYNDTVSEPGVVLARLAVGGTGYVETMCANTGDVLAVTNLDYTGYNPVALVVDASKGLLLAGTNGSVRALDLFAHTKVWDNSLRGMGYSTGMSMHLGPHGRLFVGQRGAVACLDQATGVTVWQQTMPSCGSKAVTLCVLDEQSTTLLVAGNGWLWGVATDDGQLLWKHALNGMGWNDVAMASPVWHTDWNASTLPHRRIYGSTRWTTMFRPKEHR